MGRRLHTALGHETALPVASWTVYLRQGLTMSSVRLWLDWDWPGSFLIRALSQDKAGST